MPIEGDPKSSTGRPIWQRSFVTQATCLGGFLTALGLVGYLATNGIFTGPLKVMARLEQFNSYTPADLEKFETVRRNAASYRMPALSLTPTEQDRYHFGRQLFFDRRLSKDRQTSCSSCHDPSQSFSNGQRIVSNHVELETSPSEPHPQQDQGHLVIPGRDIPPIINLQLSHWFFWDGRSDSLAAQAIEPLENPAEHNFDRAAVYQVVQRHYQDTYESLFGTLPVLAPELPFTPPTRKGLTKEPLSNSDHGETEKPEDQQPESWLSKDLAAFVVASIDSPSHRSAVGLSMTKLVEPKVRPLASSAEALDQVIANVGLALEAFERAQIANDAPFDRFLADWLAAESPDPEPHFRPGFSSASFNGLELFLGPKANCHLCHQGPNFSDQQFHNIGLPLRPTDGIDLGRSVGINLVKANAFNCQSPWFYLLPSRQLPESCQSLPYLDPELPEAVGAFKTPTLRNLADTGPYMHDGRFSSLTEVLRHYDRLPEHPTVGYRDESLITLHLRPHEYRALLAFLESLNGPLSDLMDGSAQ